MSALFYFYKMLLITTFLKYCVMDITKPEFDLNQIYELK